jgi:acyl-CoA thioester hydrolase
VTTAAASQTIRPPSRYGEGVAGRWAPDRLDPQAYGARSFTLPIFYGDLDTNGHLNNVAYGRFFEHARFTAHHEIGVAEALGPGGRVLVARVAIDYLSESRLGDPMVVRMRLARFGRTSLVEEQAAWQGDVCVALAEITIVHTHDGVASPWPDPVRNAFAQLLPIDPRRDS